MVRLVITGGGTGGHIYPALAIADGIMGRWPGTEIFYIGAKAAMESNIVPQAGYPFRGITAEGWQGRKLLNLAHALNASHKGMREALAILSGLQPEAVIGTGGFVCLPVALAAAQKRIPIYIHEQNALPGMTNRFIASMAKGIRVSFEEAAARFPRLFRHKVSATGLPVRASIAAAQRKEALDFFRLKEGQVTILTTGGSQGALRINQAMLHVIKAWHNKKGVQIIFNTGRRDYPQMAEVLAAAGIAWEGGQDEESFSNVRMLPYIDRMDMAYAAADVFVGRAGASTMAEISLCGLPALLIPLPHAAENHQAYNAASLVNKGGAVLIEDRKLTGLSLLEALEDLASDEQKRRFMAERSRGASYGRALDNILDVLAEAMEPA